MGENKDDMKEQDEHKLTEESEETAAEESDATSEQQEAENAEETSDAEETSEASEDADDPEEDDGDEEKAEEAAEEAEEAAEEAEEAEQAAEEAEEAAEEAEEAEEASEEAEEAAEEAEEAEVAAESAAAEAAAEESEPEEELAEDSEVEVDSSGEPIAVRHLEGVAAFFDHPKHLLAAAKYARDSHYEQFDAFSPFPIHGMDEAMGLGRSWIPWVTFAAGLTGFICANMLEFGTMTFDWPLIIGGKPFAPWPSFVPIMFELTVLFAGVTTAVVMLKAAGCFKKPLIIDPSITNDRFVLWISAEDERFDLDEAIEFLEDLNPLEVRKIVKDV